MNRVTVLYDATCALCIRCRDYLATHPTYLPIELLACQSAEARERYGAVPWLGEELVVASDAGEIWAGPAAFLMCIWLLREHREWSYRLTGTLAQRFFIALSHQRKRIASFLGPTRCEDGVCNVPRAYH